MKDGSSGAGAEEGTAPWLQRAPGKVALSEAQGGQRLRSPLFSEWRGQEGEDDFLACSAEQKVYPREQVGGSLWSMVDP